MDLEYGSFGHFAPRDWFMCSVHLHMHQCLLCVLYCVCVQERSRLQRGAGAATVGPRAAPLGREHSDRRLCGRRDALLPDAAQVLHAIGRVEAAGDQTRKGARTRYEYMFIFMYKFMFMFILMFSSFSFSLQSARSAHRRIACARSRCSLRRPAGAAARSWSRRRQRPPRSAQSPRRARPP